MKIVILSMAAITSLGCMTADEYIRQERGDPEPTTHSERKELMPCSLAFSDEFLRKTQEEVEEELSQNAIGRGLSDIAAAIGRQQADSQFWDKEDGRAEARVLQILERRRQCHEEIDYKLKQFQLNQLNNPQ